MLYFNFSRIFKARGIDKPFNYLVKAGYSANFATRIAHSRIQRLDLKYVERFCELFQCTPNDLLAWSPDSKDETNDKHPLIPLRRNNKVVEITQVLSSVPLDKLKDIEMMIKKEIEK